jgi:hypothetical protein
MATTNQTKTTLTFKQLMTIMEVLKAERRVQANATYTHDQIVKSALKGNPERLEYLVEEQQANYDLKNKLDYAFYAVEVMIREFE